MKSIKKELETIYKPILNKISGGTYCNVFDGGYHAVKIFKEPMIKKNINTPSFIKEPQIREIIFLSMFNHPNIVETNEIIYDDNIGYIISMEKMDGRINDSKFIKLFNEDIFYKLVYQIYNAIKYIHSFGYIHGDIKPANILYKIIDDNIIFKLCDFNITQHIEINKKTNKFTTKLYEPDDEFTTITQDIYSFGVCIFEIILLKLSNSFIKFTKDNLQIFKNEIIQIIGNNGYILLTKIAVDHYYRIYDLVNEEGAGEGYEISNLLFTKNFMKRRCTIDKLGYQLVLTNIKKLKKITTLLIDIYKKDLDYFFSDNQIEYGIYLFIEFLKTRKLNKNILEYYFFACVFISHSLIEFPNSIDSEEFIEIFNFNSEKIKKFNSAVIHVAENWDCLWKPSKN